MGQLEIIGVMLPELIPLVCAAMSVNKGPWMRPIITTEIQGFHKRLVKVLCFLFFLSLSNYSFFLSTFLSFSVFTIPLFLFFILFRMFSCKHYNYNFQKSTVEVSYALYLAGSHVKARAHLCWDDTGWYARPLLVKLHNHEYGCLCCSFGGHHLLLGKLMILEAQVGPSSLDAGNNFFFLYCF